MLAPYRPPFWLRGRHWQTIYPAAWMPLPEVTYRRESWDAPDGDQIELDWLAANPVDVLCIQELKLTDDKFPEAAFTEAGYHAVWAGQKTYNGVAIISRVPGTSMVRNIPGYEDPQQRVLALTFPSPEGDVRVVCAYCPNGQSVGSDKYAYKLDWFEAMRAWLADEIKQYPRLAVLGDYNVAPADEDVHNPEKWEGQVLVSEPERKAFGALLDLGLADSFRLVLAAALELDHGDGDAVDVQHDVGSPLMTTAQGYFLRQGEVVIDGVGPVDVVDLADWLAKRGLHISAVAQQTVGSQVGIVKSVAADLGSGLQVTQRRGDLRVGVTTPLQVSREVFRLDIAVVVAPSPFAEVVVAQAARLRFIGEQSDDTVLGCALGTGKLRHWREPPAWSATTPLPPTTSTTCFAWLAPPW